MEQYIKKSTLLTEIKRRIKTNKECMLGLRNLDYYQGKVDALNDTLSSLDTLEVKEVDTWHLQEKEDIYDVVEDWGLYKFACIMKDGTIQRFNGSLDEDCEGHINVHIDGINDDYDNVDDIVKWIEFT